MSRRAEIAVGFAGAFVVGAVIQQYGSGAVAGLVFAALCFLWVVLWYRIDPEGTTHVFLGSGAPDERRNDR